MIMRNKKQMIQFLIAIFIAALVLRFLYFPGDIYFGIDQATGAFAVEEILSGHPKLIGPSTTFPGLRHGVLYYYISAPFYFFGNGNPAFMAAFLRIINASGVFLIFALGAVLFNKYVGIIAAALYAISFEQTQFALYFNHPSLAVISILIMYLGLGLLIFKKKGYGLIIALAGLGLSIQFEFILTYLIIPFILILITFRKLIPKINFRIAGLSLITFLLTIMTFIIAEIKFSFRSAQLLPKLLIGNNPKFLERILSTYLFEMDQVIKFSLVGVDRLKNFTGLVLLLSFIALVLTKANKQAAFLGIWFFSALIIYFITGGDDITVGIIQYHPNVGISLSLAIFVSYILYSMGKKLGFILPVVLIVFIAVLNFSLIQKFNPLGSMPEINAQSFMLLSDEEEVLDYLYQDAAGKPFAVSGITMPYIINTTWSYLFEWYGQQRYGYLPVWNGKNALGYPGNLKVQEAQEGLPDVRYLIIEPVRGIPEHLINEYLQNESYFTYIQEEHKIGHFIVQKRRAK